MSLFTKLANDVFSPVDAGGTQRSVENIDAQRWGSEIERILQAFQAGGGIIFPSRSAMDEMLEYPPNQMAWVLGDSVTENNGIYRKISIPGSGSWTRLGDLPFSFIRATTTGGSPNAIAAASNLPIPEGDGGALISLSILNDNTGSPVTVSFGGGSPLTIKSNSGNDIAPGGLKASMVVAGYKVGSTFRLLSDQAGAAILAAAEDAANRAAAYAAMLSIDKIKFKTVVDLLADTIMSYTSDLGLVQVGAGDVVDAQGFRYEVAASDATDHHVETAGGAKLYVVPVAGTYSAEAFGLPLDNTVDATLALQRAIDLLDNGLTVIIPPRRFKVSKNAALPDYPGDDQPCLEVRGKKNCTIEAMGAVLEVAVHGQGAVEFQLCEDMEIIGLATEGPGQFPLLEGATGRGEKGSGGEGYPTAGFVSARKNNSYDTSAFTDGGYGGAFPQWGGGTAPTWGVWNGGFIGNGGSGILIHNGCKRLTFYKCSGRLFNMSGIQIGFHGDVAPVNLEYPNSENINLIECEGSDNYTYGISYGYVDGFKISKCIAHRNGHHDADPATDTFADPGYGICGYGNIHSPGRDGEITSCHAYDNIRKGIDLHAGVSTRIRGNTLRGNAVGGIYTDQNGTGESITESNENIISENYLDGNGYCKNGTGQIFIGGDENVDHDLKTIIDKNIINNTWGSAIFANQPRRCQVTNNIIGKKAARRRMGEVVDEWLINIRGGVGTDYTEDVLVSGNTIEDDLGIYGINLLNLRNSQCFGNRVIMTSPDALIGIGANGNQCLDLSVHDNNVKMGAAGQPYVLTVANGNCYNNQYSGGSVDSILYPSIKRRQAVLDYIQFDLTFNGTNTPAKSNVIGSEYVGAVESEASGVKITLNGPSNTATICNATFTVVSTNGVITTGSTNIAFFHPISLTTKELRIGLRSAMAGTQHPANTITSGVLRVSVTFG